MCTRGPENDWKPCFNWPDSGSKYPGGPVFPEPEGGFSKEDNEKYDFFRSVMDWWQGHDYSTADLISWVSKALDDRRQYEILNYWVQYKLPPGMHLSIDMSTLGPEFEELVERAKALQVGAADESTEGVKGGERPMWKYRDIEPGEEADQDWREGGLLKRPGVLEEKGMRKSGRGQEVSLCLTQLLKARPAPDQRAPGSRTRLGRVRLRGARRALIA
jgi:hypothetical protein